VAFGASLAEKPLHLDTLAGLAAEHEAALQLAFHAVALLGRDEAGALDAMGQATLRLLQPLVKLTTARMAVAGASETLEAFGGAGYVEDTGLPELLRDAQVLSIWEGTTNVLSLEAARAIGRADALPPFVADLASQAAAARDPRLVETARIACTAAERAARWWGDAAKRGAGPTEAGLRRFALTLGRSMALALLSAQAQWSLDREGDARSVAAAQRFAAAGVDLVTENGAGGRATAALALDEPVGPEA
jgi:hypothetical protein